jgi:superfamily II DNA/RNA helicase
MLTDHHAKYYAYELTRQASGENVDRISTSLFDASVDLNPHQIEAALFALRSPLSKGVVLADEVGLGKTIEAGLVLCQYWAERKRNLIIICPASLRRQWAAELSEKFNLSSVILDAFSVRQMHQNGVYNFFRQNKLIILSYHFACRMEEQLVSIPWDLVVIDEAHKLRNAHKPNNRMGQTLRRAFNGRKKLLLTATPLQNSLMELYGLSTLIDEQLFGDDKAFRKQYLNSGGNLTELRTRLNSFIKRTLRKQVLEYVRYTERRALTQPFTPSDDEQKLYEALSAFLLREDSYALPKRQRHLTALILRKLMASSTTAITATLEQILKRLQSLATLATPDESLLMDLIEHEEIEDEYLEAIDDAPLESDTPTDGINKAQLSNELEELRTYLQWARDIPIDAKTNQLITAVEAGFREMARMGAARKAIIFTESRRTQEYLKHYLSQNGYRDKLVTFNGVNTDADSTGIYQQWLELNQDSDKVTGSHAVDCRTALIEHFRDNADIMIATEAAAEGVNLQFCSLVINYDLPWNPQRIEQRIGRCHRYGQKFDVVVINFLNQRNYADQRVLELLTDKFNLFNGVFGASDEVLGRIENGIDFEKRILDIYQTCRSSETIAEAFKQLQLELEADIAEKMDDTRQLLIEHFDETIHDLLKFQLDQAKERLDRVGRLFWQVTRHILDGQAQFDEDRHDFVLTQTPNHSIATGHYRLIRKEHPGQTPTAEHIYRLTHPLGEYVLQQAKNSDTPVVQIQFDISHHPTKLSLVEALKGESGWLSLDLLTVQSLQTEEHLVFTGLTDANMPLDQETCEKLFLCHAANAPLAANTSFPSLLLSNAEMRGKAVVNRIIENNNRFFQTERDKLEKWADDKIVSAEHDLQDTKAKLKSLKREARLAESVEQQRDIQLQISDLEKLQRRQRQQIFDIEDEIIEKRDAMIDELEKRITQTTSTQRLFTIRWALV